MGQTKTGDITVIRVDSILGNRDIFLYAPEFLEPGLYGCLVFLD